jgi:23S rRNA (uracil1939-C5)-methyltransferase
VVVDLFVERLVQGGDGLAQLDGLKVFVPYSAPQEQVRARIARRAADYAVAEIVEVVEPSPLRVAPACPYYGRCGGCQLQHISHQGQRVAKKALVNETLQRLGRVFVPVANITGPATAWHYRNKTQYPARQEGRPGGAGLRLGFFRRNSHQLVDAEECLLHPPEFDSIRRAVIDAARTGGEDGYSEAAHSGNIRHVVLRQASVRGGVVVTVVTRMPGLKKDFVAALADTAGIAGIIQSVSPHRTNRILGSRLRLLCGSGTTCQTVLGRELRASAASFLQVNTVQAEELCRKVLKHAAPCGTEKVLDLYSGVGMLSFVLADFVAHVTGVEIDADAVGDAKANALRLGTANVEFRCGDVEHVLAGFERADVVLLDPPRRGCPPSTLGGIVRLKPRRIVYVSCNPATLARDLNVLEQLGYETQAVEPVDMFPQTAHVEVVAQLSPANR